MWYGDALQCVCPLDICQPFFQCSLDPQRVHSWFFNRAAATSGPRHYFIPGTEEGRMLRTLLHCLGAPGLGIHW